MCESTLIMDRKNFDFVVLGGGMLGTYAAYSLLKRGYSVAVIHGSTDEIFLDNINVANAAINDVMNEPNRGNSTRWGGRLSLAGLRKDERYYHVIKNYVENVVKNFGIDEFDDAFTYIPDDDSMRVMAHSVAQEAEHLFYNVREIITEYQDDDEKLVSVGLPVCYNKALLVCCGTLGNASIILRSQDELTDIQYSGHLSGCIGTVKFLKKNYPQYQRFGKSYRQKILSHFDDDSGYYNILFNIVNYPFNDPRNNSCALSLVYLLLSSPIGGYFLSKPILKKLLSTDFNWKHHFLNILKFTHADYEFLKSLIFQKFFLKRRNPVALLQNKDCCFPLHVHINLDKDAGCIQLKGSGISVNLSNKIDGCDGISKAIEKQCSLLDKKGISVSLEENYLEKIKKTSIDGYHQMCGSSQMANHDYINKKKIDHIHFFSTGLLSGSLPHFPTLSALCIVHGIISEKYGP